MDPEVAFRVHPRRVRVCWHRRPPWGRQPLIEDRIAAFTADTFSARLGESFLVRPGDRPDLATELIEATRLGKPAQDGGRVPFSLVFRGRADVVLPQRIYPLEHEELGAFELFLVPIGPDEKGMRYEAVFT